MRLVEKADGIVNEKTISIRKVPAFDEKAAKKIKRSKLTDLYMRHIYKFFIAF